MSVYELLEQKGTLVYTISAEAGVDQCIQLLNEKNIGALLVTGRGGEVEGIVTERDILREAGRRKGKVWSLAVGEIMIPRANMITAHQDDPIELIMERMTNHRIRRLWLGESTVSEGLTLEQLCSIESNIDDCNPQLLGHLLEKLLALGALDATFIPQQMKKDRPGTLLTVLCRPDLEGRVLDAIFQETTTIGVRRQIVDRMSLPRREETVQTDYGPIRVKIVEWKGIERASPEYEDCRRAAGESNVPVHKVMEACFRRI